MEAEFELRVGAGEPSFALFDLDYFGELRQCTELRVLACLQATEVS